MLKCVPYFERPVDVIVGGDVRVLSGLLEALQRRRLHVDDVGPQLVGSHCLNGLNGEITQKGRTFEIKLLCVAFLDDNVITVL